MAIGRNLQIALNDINMTVAELSRRSGVSTNTLYAIIRRDSKKVDTTILKKICEASGIPIYDLLDDVMSDEDFPLYDYLCAETDADRKDAKDRVVKYLKNKDSALSSYIVESLETDEMFMQISSAYNSLNFLGKKEAHKRVQELTEIPRYTKPDTPELNAAHAIPNATEEDQPHDEDVMDDENF